MALAACASPRPSPKRGLGPQSVRRSRRGCGSCGRRPAQASKRRAESREMRRIGQIGHMLTARSSRWSRSSSPRTAPARAGADGCDETDVDEMDRPDPARVRSVSRLAGLHMCAHPAHAPHSSAVGSERSRGRQATCSARPARGQGGRRVPSVASRHGRVARGGASLPRLLRGTRWCVRPAANSHESAAANAPAKAGRLAVAIARRLRQRAPAGQPACVSNHLARWSGWPP